MPLDPLSTSKRWESTAAAGSNPVENVTGSELVVGMTAQGGAEGTWSALAGAAWPKGWELGLGANSVEVPVSGSSVVDTAVWEVRREGSATDPAAIPAGTECDDRLEWAGGIDVGEPDPEGVKATASEGATRPGGGVNPGRLEWLNPGGGVTRGVNPTGADQLGG